MANRGRRTHCASESNASWAGRRTCRATTNRSTCGSPPSVGARTRAGKPASSQLRVRLRRFRTRSRCLVAVPDATGSLSRSAIALACILLFGGPHRLGPGRRLVVGGIPETAHLLRERPVTGDELPPDPFPRSRGSVLHRPIAHGRLRPLFAEIR